MDQLLSFRPIWNFNHSQTDLNFACYNLQHDFHEAITESSKSKTVHCFAMWISDNNVGKITKTYFFGLAGHHC